jgi:hypothetical protein
LGTRKSYDIYIPSKKLAVEHHGLIWHSEKYSGTKADYDKSLIAVNRGDRLIQIYADEWKNKRNIMERMLCDAIKPTSKKRINPIFTVERGTPKDARGFLDANHYLGAASGCLTVVAKYKEEIVGCWVFMKREAHTVLWHRACWDCRFKAWNPHEKALTMAKPSLKAMEFTRMVTFSDNRFHTGSLYEKLGFTFEKELRPDYGYTNGVKRVSKYAFRVKAGVNEKQAARVGGWYRIWDSGKRRYSMPL